MQLGYVLLYGIFNKTFTQEVKISVTASEVY